MLTYWKIRNLQNFIDINFKKCFWYFLMQICQIWNLIATKLILKGKSLLKFNVKLRCGKNLPLDLSSCFGWQLSLMEFEGKPGIENQFLCFLMSLHYLFYNWIFENHKTFNFGLIFFSHSLNFPKNSNYPIILFSVSFFLMWRVNVLMKFAISDFPIAKTHKRNILTC